MGTWWKLLSLVLPNTPERSNIVVSPQVHCLLQCRDKFHGACNRERRAASNKMKRIFGTKKEKAPPPTIEDVSGKLTTRGDT